jgi:serine/threonine protein kinase
VKEAASPPTRIGGYRIIGVLGRGSCSVVYRVERVGGMGFARQFALKVLQPGFADSEALSRMFIDEASVASHLHHRHVVSVHEFGRDGARWFLVMDLVEGLDLLRLLQALRQRGSWLSRGAALSVALQLLEGLHHAHTRTDADGRYLGIVHRDLAPPNVLVGDNGLVRVTDFGMARIRHNLSRTEAGVVVGSVRFMSPEQALGRPVDARADVFSVGSLLYMLLTGRLPFSGLDDEEVRVAVAKGVARPLLTDDDIPSALQQRLARMMAVRPEDRYATARQAADDLVQVLDADWFGVEEERLADVVRQVHVVAA